MWKEGKSVSVSQDMPAWWPTGSYSECITWVSGKKNKIVDKIATLKEKKTRKAQLVIAEKLAAEELKAEKLAMKAEKLATRKLEAQMLETRKKSASKMSPHKKVMIFCASQDDLFQFPNSSEEASSRKICRKFGISDLELTNIYIKEMEKIGNGNKYPCN